MHCLSCPSDSLYLRGSGLQPVLLNNSLGPDLRIRTAVADRQPGIRHIGFDKRSHALSATPEGDRDTKDFAGDDLVIRDHLSVERALVADCSGNGRIVFAVAPQHAEHVSAALMLNTTARTSISETWATWIGAAEIGDMAAISLAVSVRWVAPARHWERMLPPRCESWGSIRTCGPLAGADLTRDPGRITCPVLCSQGSQDHGTRLDIACATIKPVPGAHFIRLGGFCHLPAIDAPEETACLLKSLLEEAHV